MPELSQDNLNLPSGVKTFIRFLGGLSILLGVLVMIGWFCNLPALIKIQPTLNSMKFNTALGFFLGGVGILFIFNSQRTVTQVAGVLLMTVGALTLWQYIRGESLGIDQIFMRDYLTASSQFPGRMAPQSALCFFLFGIGLFIDRLVKIQNVVMFWRCLCGAFLFVIGNTAIFGFFTHISFAYTWGSYNALALHTAIGFFILGTAMMLTSMGNAYISLIVISLGGISLGLQVCYGLLQYKDPYIETLIPWLLLTMILLCTASAVFSIYTQIKRRITVEKIVTSGFGTALVLLIGVSILSNYHMKQLAEDARWVDHTYNVLLQFKDLFADAKTGARSFILTGDERDLEPYKLAVTHIIHPMNEARHLTMDNPIQQERLNLVESLIKEKFAITDRLIALKRNRSPTDFILLSKGSNILDKLRVLEHDSEDEEYELLKFRAIREKATNKILVISTNTGNALAFLIILMAIIIIFRHNQARRLSEEKVMKSEERLKIATKGGGIGIWDWDIINNVLLWDEQMYKIYGIKKENSLPAYEAWQAGVHPDDAIRSHEEIQQTFRNDKEFDTEFRIIWPDKSIHYIKASGIVQRDSEGNPIRMIGMNWDITERSKLKEELLKFSTYDELTGLYNRRGFKFLVEQQFKEARRSQKAIILFLIDLNKMKNINDQFGHHAGDLALIDTAKLLKKSFRETDIIARWGGDEFVVLGAGTAEKDTPIIKKRLEINLYEYNLKSKQDFKISMSIGEFVADHDSKDSLEELIIEADKKMYQQKKASPNQT